LLLAAGFSALATILLRLGHPDRQNAMREELFKRMVFNILMDNTDDHERNHCARLNFDGYHDLAPAFDVLPALQNLGYQSLSVGLMVLYQRWIMRFRNSEDLVLKGPEANLVYLGKRADKMQDADLKKPAWCGLYENSKTLCFSS
jgi:HipA-like C-terminal domain